MWEEKDHPGSHLTIHICTHVAVRSLRYQECGNYSHQDHLTPLVGTVLPTAVKGTVNVRSVERDSSLSGHLTDILKHSEPMERSASVMSVGRFSRQFTLHITNCMQT